MTGPRTNPGRVAVTLPRVVRAEWTKLVSLRSTWLTLAGVAGATVALAAAIGYGIGESAAAGDPPPDLADAVSAAFLPVDFMVLVVAVLGVVQVTGEYPGPIRATLTAVPRRGPVVVAKAAVLAALTAPVLAATALGAFLACQAFLGTDGASLGDPGVPRAVAGAAACAVLMSLFGLGVGTLLRRTAAAVTTLVVVLFVVPLLLGPVLPGDREDDVLKFLPTLAGQAMYGLSGPDRVGGTPFETLSPGASAAVLVAWTAAVLGAGIALLRYRDA